MRTLVLAMVVACSKPTPRPAPAPAPAPASAPASNAIIQLSAAEGDGAAAAAIATKYLRGIVAHDWAAVCATRTHHERDEMARVARSCEEAMQTVFAKQPVEVFAHATIGGIRRRNEIVAVDVLQPGQTQPATTLLLERDGNVWALVDLPDDDTF